MMFAALALAAVWPTWMAPTASPASAAAWNELLAGAGLATWDLDALRLDLGRYRLSWRSRLGRTGVDPSAVTDAALPTAVELWERHVYRVAPEEALDLSRALLGVIVCKTSLAATSKAYQRDDVWVTELVRTASELANVAAPLGSLPLAEGGDDAAPGAAAGFGAVQEDDYTSEPETGSDEEDEPSDVEVERALQPKAVILEDRDPSRPDAAVVPAPTGRAPLARWSDEWISIRVRAYGDALMSSGWTVLGEMSLVTYGLVSSKLAVAGPSLFMLWVSAWRVALRLGRAFGVGGGGRARRSAAWQRCVHPGPRDRPAPLLGQSLG